MLSPVNAANAFTWIPYGSDHFWLTYDGNPPGYPDFRPYVPNPWTPGSINDSVFAGDELNGGGVNWPREIWGWDDIGLSRPSVLAGVGNDDPVMPHEDGQTVDIWIGREKRLVYVLRDHNKVRAEGWAGHIDERHPR